MGELTTSDVRRLVDTAPGAPGTNLGMPTEVIASVASDGVSSGAGRNGIPVVNTSLQFKKVYVVTGLTGTMTTGEALETGEQTLKLEMTVTKTPVRVLVTPDDPEWEPTEETVTCEIRPTVTQDVVTGGKFSNGACYLLTKPITFIGSVGEEEETVLFGTTGICCTEK